MRGIDIRDLLDRPGSARTVRVQEPVEGLHSELADVPTPVEGELLLESVVEGIFVSGTLSGRMQLECARCLEGFERDFDLHVSELFLREPEPQEDQYALSAEGELDPEPMVRDAVVLAMPFSPLCRPDCKGLCERCGGNRNLGECTCTEPPADPRWSDLERLVK